MTIQEENEGFIQYWEANRLRKKKVWRQLSVGLPMAVALVVTILINMISNWNKQAELVLKKEQSSLIIVLIAACLGIVVFIVIFSARHRWDQNEQHYKELLAKREKH